MRVIADHVRTLTFAIGDGATPSNEGRGYVLRRILRRAARFGRNLGMHEPFIYQLVPTLVETMSYIFPEIKTNQDHIQRVIKGEEESFNETLDRGLYYFENVVGFLLYEYLKKTESVGKKTDYSIHSGKLGIIEKEPDKKPMLNKLYDIKEKLLELNFKKIISGADAFELKDTFGLPEDLIVLMAKEYGAEVDLLGFEKLMEEQKKRSRETRVSLSGNLSFSGSLENPVLGGKESARKLETSKYEKSFRFVGYDKLEADSSILLIKDNLVVLESTPFYGESGGQVGDTGEITTDKNSFHIIDTQKSGSVNVHILDKPLNSSSGKAKAKVDKERRLSIQRNHSATHLLHKALRQILGTHVQQAGSLVAPDYFRFDFSHFAKLSEQELADIEALVNEKIKENIPRTPGLNNIPFEDAKKMGALMFFGDKYGERVNVIQFGDFSTEFCGGTHVNNTGEIGFFKIRSEGSVASGVRRIEGVTHIYARELLVSKEEEYVRLLKEESNLIINMQQTIKMFPATSPISKNNTSSFEIELKEFEKPLNIPSDIINDELNLRFHEQESRFHKLKDFINRLSKKEKELSIEFMRAKSIDFSSEIDSLLQNAQILYGIKIVAKKIDAGNIEALKSYGDTLRSKLGSGVGVLASVIEDKVQLVCVVTDDLVAAKTIEAGKVIGAVAKIVGGGGGGRPHMATAGGKDIAKIDEALSHTKSIVESLLKKNRKSDDNSRTFSPN
jgi:alanyl-tRNA synthetase